MKRIKRILKAVNDKKYYFYAMSTMFCASMLPVHATLGEATGKVVDAGGSEVDGAIIGVGIGVVLVSGILLAFQKRKLAMSIVVFYVIGGILIKNRVAFAGLLNSFI